MPELGNVAGHRSFGALLREFRLAAGLSQEVLAERAAMSADGISALERGVNKAPQRETLGLLLGALQLEPQEREAIEAAAMRPSRPRVSRTRASKKHNLPKFLTPLFGRETEVAEVERLVASSHIVTVIGAGGVGKTRLAVETGSSLALSDCEDGVWFVDLAPAHDAAGVASAIATTLGIRERPDATLLESIAYALARKSVLLILDNCEQVATAAAAAVQTILAGCPDVRILATSRQPLAVPGEQTYRVASLNLEASAALFIESARRADPSFVPDDDRLTIERICQRLDGIALAIELAAARVRLLSVVQIEERLSERFAVLTGGGRLARHQTMRALVDWSYELLSQEEQMLFARLAVFPAEFSLEAVLAICSGVGVAEPHVLEVLGSLVDKSLVNSERRGKARRFRLLETMHAYALEKLGGGVDALSHKHAQFYLKLVNVTDRHVSNWVEIIEAEYDNLRRALEWAIDEGADIELGVRLLAGMQEFLLIRGFGPDAARRAERALAGPTPLPKPLQAMAWETITAMRGDLLLPSQAHGPAGRLLALCEELGDYPGMARALRARGVASLRAGLFEQAQDDLNRALEICKRVGEQREVARTLASIAVAYEITGRLEEARRTALDVLEIALQEDDERVVWVSMTNLAETEFALGEIEAAVRRLDDLLASRMARKNVRLRANTRSNLSAYLLALHRDEEARAMARAAVFDAREAGDAGILACAIGHLATMLANSDPRNAAKLLGYVESVFAGGYHREPTERYTYELLITTLHRLLSDEEIAAAQQEGAAMSELQAMRLATRGRAPAFTP
ncbi:MAG: tetratricopeptide repeat protein [Candidatus Cybelea sp.]